MTHLMPLNNPVAIHVDDILAVLSSVYKIMEKDNVGNACALADLIQILADFSWMDESTMMCSGTVDVVVDIMTERCANELIQERGCGILARLSSMENLDVNMNIVETEGVDVIVNAMIAFPENVRLQTECCRAIAHLSAHEECRVMIVANSGLQLIAKASQQFSGDEAFLMVATKAVRRLLSSSCLNTTNETLQGIVLETEMIHLLLDCMLTHSESSVLQENCADALSKIAQYGPTLRRHIAEASGINILVATIRQHMEIIPVLKTALSALSNILVNGENSMFLQNTADNDVDMVVWAMSANWESVAN